MLKKISIAIFWLAFFGFLLYKLIPKYKYLIDDTHKHWGSHTSFDNSIFALHIFAGIIVYIQSRTPPAFRLRKYFVAHMNLRVV